MPRRSKTLSVGSPAPDFTLATPEGAPWRLREYLPLALFFLRGTF